MRGGRSGDLFPAPCNEWRDVEVSVQEGAELREGHEWAHIGSLSADADQQKRQRAYHQHLCILLSDHVSMQERACEKQGLR